MLFDTGINEGYTVKEKIAEYVKKNPGVDALDVADIFDIDLGEAANIISELMDLGILVRDDSKSIPPD